MRALVATALALLATAPVTGGAQTFWQGTKYGDSIEKVRATVPNASLPQTSEELRRNDIATLVAAPAIIAGRRFNASLQFSAAGLERVILIAEPLSEAEANATHDVLIKALREKYGRSVMAADPGQAVMEDKPFWMRWVSGDTDITLVAQHHSSGLMVAYTLGRRAKQRSDTDAAQKYLKKADPKAEAGKL